MIKITNVSETDYFLPEDGAMAKAKLLEIMALETETWISGYAFTMLEAFAELEKLADKGIGLHLLLDYTQYRIVHVEPVKNALKSLMKHIKNGSLVLTTAGINSPRKSAIWHWKSMVKASTDIGVEPWCWEGSANFSTPAWFQGNSARLFQSMAWAEAFIAQHDLHEQWAKDNLPHYQPQILAMGMESVVDVYFNSIASVGAEE